MKKLILISILIFHLNGCKEVNKIVAPDNKPVILAHKTISEITPQSAFKSDIILIKGKYFDSLGFNKRVSFNGGFCNVDSSSDSTMYVRVPINAITGSIIVFNKALTDSIVGPMFTLSQPTNTNLHVKVYSGSTITEQQTWINDLCSSNPKQWEGAHTTDTISLKISSCGGGDQLAVYTLKFISPNGYTIPRSVEGTLYYQNLLFTRIDTLRGAISINKWNLNDTVSGHCSWYGWIDTTWQEFDFFYNFKK
jgi:hypothetical protein